MLLAWSVSLSPSGSTYASAGGHGNITIRSAEPENFGKKVSTAFSGRNKFGMCCSYVRVYLDPYSVITERSSRLLEPGRKTRRTVLGDWTCVHPRRRIEYLRKHIHLSRNVCALCSLVSRWQRMSIFSRRTATSTNSLFMTQLLLSASEDKRLILYDVRVSSRNSGGAVATFSGHSSWVLCADISPDSRFGLSG